MEALMNVNVGIVLKEIHHYDNDVETTCLR